MRVAFEVTPLGINVLLEPFLPQSTRKTQQTELIVILPSDIIVSFVAKCYPFSCNFIRENRKKSAGDRSGE